jgi:hypothetical protein
MPTTESSSSLRFVLPTGFFLRGTLRLEEDAAYSRHTFHFLPLENSKASHQAMFTQFVHPKHGMKPTTIPISARIPHARLNACIKSPLCAE